MTPPFLLPSLPFPAFTPKLGRVQWLPPNTQDVHPPHKDFPPPDLLTTLIDLYFANMNDFLPLLHRPTFEQGVREGLHFRDEGFGSTVLLVCANGARFSDDPRVLLDEREHPQSAGWKWFQQVQMVRKSLLEPPRLYDLQIYAVCRSLRSLCYVTVSAMCLPARPPGTLPPSPNRFL